MRKHFIWTILVLAALTACNKEVETPIVDNGQEDVTPGKVTLTFTAAIGDETRTEYPDDKTAGWVVGDKISVCVTNENKTAYEVAEFEATNATDAGMEFTGEVEEGYTSIVSGVYPANENHVFTDGAVTSVYLPDTYELGTANDGGIALPMVGAMDENDNFVFHHICGALKITVIDIFNALTFTTAGETITGSFPLTNGRIEMPAEGASSTVTFNYDRLSTNPAVGERGNRTFYIPVPDGTLTAGATMALKKRNNNTLTTAYEKTTTGSIQFTSNVIKRLQAIGLEHQDANSWRIVVTEPDDPDIKGAVAQYVPSGTTFIRLFTTLDSFNSSDYHGSVAEFIEKRGLTYTTYTGSKNITMSNPISYYYGKKYVILTCEVNTQNGRMVTFNYRKLEYEFASAEYAAWLGKWSVSDGTNTDTWTITRKETNKTYNVTGLCGRSNSAFKVEAHLSENGGLLFKTQKNVGTVLNSGYETAINLYRKKTSNGNYYSTANVDLMEASIQSETSASLSASNQDYPFYTFIGTYTDDQGNPQAGGYGTRPATATMTRVTE